METCTRKMFSFKRRKRENYKFVLYICLYVLYNPPLSRIYRIYFERLLGLVSRSASDDRKRMKLYVYILPSSVCITIMHQSHWKILVSAKYLHIYSLNYYSYLSCLYMTTERKSICVAN